MVRRIRPDVVGEAGGTSSVPQVRHPHPDQLCLVSSVASAKPIPAAQNPELLTIVRGAQSGDLAAQSELVRRYSRRVSGQISVIVRQPNAIEDVTQLAFIKMVRSLPSLRDPAVFEPWLFTLSRSTALDFIRRQKCRPCTVAAEHEWLNAPAPDHDHGMADILEALELALQRLGQKDRSLMTMLVDGHDYRTLAAREGLTLGAVKARLSRIRTFLRVAVGTATGTRVPSADELSTPPKCRLAA